MEGEGEVLVVSWSVGAVPAQRFHGSAAAASMR